MLKKTLLFAFGALLAQSGMAETLSPEAALQRASSNNQGRRVISSQMQPKLVYTAKTNSGMPAVYVFNQGNAGSLLLSASDVAIPVLGYTDSGSFDPANLPPQMKFWLEEYAAQIAYAEENGLQPKDKNITYNYPTDWKYIAPLVQTQWDQGKPYNNLVNGYPTGCVATAMAQIMNYWKYPEIGHGSISYTTNGTNYSMKFDEQPFDWKNMIDSYDGSYTNAEANAVAYLMKACGYSVQMMYRAGGSGSQVERAALALVNYFGYDENVDAIQRNSFTHTEWATMLYDQLCNVGPVLYSGHSLGNMAHAFVCDGYDGQGYFHINWGWSGMCDGYYSLDALNPTVQGTGGSNYGGFNFSQGMILNIKKSEGTPTFTPQPMMTLLGNVTATNASTIVTFNVSHGMPGSINNNSMVTITPVIGVCTENESTGEKVYAQASGVYFDGQQYNIPAMNPGSFIDATMSVRARFDNSLPDGKYKMQLVWKNGMSDTQWKNFLIGTGCHDYIYITKEGSKYTTESLPLYRFKIESAEVVTPLYMRNPCEIKFTITNPTDYELSQGIIPVLYYNGTRSFEADSQLVTVAPHETLTTTLMYTFSSVAGATLPTVSEPLEYTLGAYDYGIIFDKEASSGAYGEAYYGDFGTVTMKRSASTARLTLRGISIDNAEEEGQNDEIGYLYGISDFSNIKLSVKLAAANGFISSPLTAVVYEYDPESRTNVKAVYEQNFENIVYLENGEVSTEDINLHMKDYDVNKIYNVVVYYVQQNTRTALGNLRFAASSGVEEITSDSFILTFDGNSVKASSEAGIVSLAIYDLSGKTVTAPSCGRSNSVEVNVAGLSKGIYLVRAADAAGNVKTVKVSK